MNSQAQVPSQAVETTTINDLHDEILILIMTFNAFRLYQPISTWDVQFEAAPNHKHIPWYLQDTINASQVCCHWRIIALASPELWSHMIDMEHPRPEWTKLLLNRSEPLGIAFIYSSRSKADNPFELEMRLNTRINEYRMCILPHQRLLHVLSYHFKIWGDFPRLKALNIQLDRVSWRKYDLVNRTKVLQDLFPPNATPNLQHLYTRGIAIHCPGLKSLQKLTTLHILHPPLNGTLEVDSFLDILPDIPFLKDLSLIYAFQKSTSNKPSSRHITLPLVKLVLHDYNDTFSEVIQSVTFQNKDLRHYDLAVLGEEDDLSKYHYLTQILTTLSYQTTRQQTPISQHQCNNIVFTHNGFKICHLDKISTDLIPPTRVFHFHFPPIDKKKKYHTFGNYFSLGEVYSSLIRMIILGFPTSFCATIDTVMFSAFPVQFPSTRHGECMDWLLAFFKSVFCEKLSHVHHLFAVPWNWGRFMHAAIMGLPINGWEKAIQSHLSDSEVLDILSSYSDFNGITSYPACGKGSEGVTLDLDFSALKSNQNTRSNDPVTIEVVLDNHGTTCIQEETTNHNQSTKDSKSESDLQSANERWTTSYLVQPIDSGMESVGDRESSDTGSLYDPNLSPTYSSGSDFELELTLYEGLVELCQDISTIRKVCGVPRADESIEPDVCDLFKPRSMKYLEDELKVLGVEVEFCSA